MASNFSFRRALAACSVLAICTGPIGWAEPQTVKISQFSGKEVPRFESLRYSAVHGRQGPSLDHPILWRYEKTGLPVLILRETHNWRRVRDHQGDEVWIQARMLSAETNVLILRDTLLLEEEAETSDPRAQLKAGLVAELLGCASSTCEIKIDKTKGWVLEADLWGTETQASGL